MRGTFALLTVGILAAASSFASAALVPLADSGNVDSDGADPATSAYLVGNNVPNYRAFFTWDLSGQPTSGFIATLNFAEQAGSAVGINVTLHRILTAWDDEVGGDPDVTYGIATSPQGLSFASNEATHQLNVTSLVSTWQSGDNFGLALYGDVNPGAVLLAAPTLDITLVTAVPEPTGLLALAGVGAMLLGRRRIA